MENGKKKGRRINMFVLLVDFYVKGNGCVGAPDPPSPYFFTSLTREKVIREGGPGGVGSQAGPPTHGAGGVILAFA